ncbi:MAG: hypothetical protein AAF191_15995, partial [Verrucomicrobiota bacterium]
MRAVIHRDCPFLSQWRTLVNSPASGGTEVRALRHLLEGFRQGQAPAASAVLDDLRHATVVPYELGDQLLLLTLQTGEVVLLHSLKSVEEARDWVQRHPNVRLLAHRAGSRFQLATTGDVELADLPLGALDDTFEAEGPLLSQVQGLDWKKRIRHRRLAKRLLSIEAPVEVEELHECLDLLQSRDPQLAELITEVFFYLMDHRRDQAQLTVDRYAAEKSNAESQTAGIPDEWAQATDPEEVVVLEQLTESALDRILEPGNFQNWMQFLHPDQQKRVDEDHGHPIVLRGVSGSGKTVVVVHRARRLARAFPNARVVVLTLHHDLAILLNDLVDLLAGDDDLANLRVYSLAGYFRTILRSIGHEAAFRDWGQYLFGEEEGQALGRDYALRSEDQVFTPQPDWVYQNLFQDFLTEYEEEYAAEWELIRK